MNSQVKKYLQLEYPTQQNDIKLYGFIGLLIGLFLLLFEPFGLKDLAMDFKALFLFSYGLLIAVLLTLNLFLFKHLYHQGRWTIHRQILLTLSAVLCIGIGLYFYSLLFKVFAVFDMEGLFVFFKQTLAVAIFPILATLFGVNQRKPAQEVSIAITKGQVAKTTSKTLRLYSQNKKSFVDVVEDRILYIESKGNYVRIASYEEPTKKLRSTLRNILEQIGEETYMVRVHRAYVVNQNKIRGWEGHSRKLALHLFHYDDPIPVSRGYTKVVMQQYAAADK